MAQIQKQKLSGSTDGRPILVVATATPGTLIHTAQTGTATGKYDEIWLWATTTGSTGDIQVTIEFGGVTGTDQISLLVANRSGPVLLVPGLILQNGVVVRAFANTASAATIVGFVNAALTA